MNRMPEWWSQDAVCTLTKIILQCLVMDGGGQFIDESVANEKRASGSQSSNS